MATTEYSNIVIPSLPSPITGDGLFAVNVVVPTTETPPNLFEPSSAKPSTSYSYPLMDPAKLIGTGSQPYMNVALPAYISTLYNNVFNINNNLENDISTTSSVDDRKYPTSFAVQNYVQSMLSGTQLINGNNNTNIVNTMAANTIIQTSVSSAFNFQYVYNGSVKKISLFWMDEADNGPRDGASKLVMFSAPNYLSTTNGGVTTPSYDLAFLYAGDNSYFMNLGQQYKYYQFVIVGDYIEFVQSRFGDGADAGWLWLVKNALGNFTNNILVTDGDSDGSIDKVDKNPPVPVPETGIKLTLTGN
jgi:hypothetical protein